MGASVRGHMTADSAHKLGKSEVVALSPAAKFFRDSSIFSMSRVLGALFGLVQSFLVAKYLGPYSFGIWQFVSIFERYSSYASIGTQSAITRIIPFLRGRGDTHGMQRFLNASFTVNLFNPIIYSLFVLTYSFSIKQPLESKILASYSPIILLLSWIGYNNVVLMSMGFYKFRSRLGILQDGLTMCLCVIFVHLFGIYGLVLGFLTSTSVIFSISSYNLWSKFSIKFDWRFIFDLVFTWIPIMANGLLLTTMGIIDRVLIAAFLNRDVLGFYSIASVGINILKTVLSSIGQMLFVKFAEMEGQNRTPNQTLSILDKTTTVLSCLFSPLISLMIVFIPAAISILLPQFASGIPAGRILLAETFFLGISLPSTNWCISTGRFIPVLIFRVISIAIEVVSIYSVILYHPILELISLCVLSTSIIFSLFIAITVNHLLRLSLIGAFTQWIRWVFPFSNIIFVIWVQEHYYTIGVGIPRAQLLESCILGLLVSLIAVISLAFWSEGRTQMIELISESLMSFLKRRNSTQAEDKLGSR